MKYTFIDRIQHLNTQIQEQEELIKIYKESKKGNKSKSYAYKMSEAIDRCNDEIAKLESCK